MTDKTGRAFPNKFGSGMTLRDYFAAQALNGIFIGYWSDPEMTHFKASEIAEEAYVYADAMLAEREKDRKENDNG